MKVVDIFAGPGGWDVGLNMLGYYDTVGLELDRDACDTRALAGHFTVRCDVEQYGPERFLGYDGLIASPPCTDFSLSGLKAGITGSTGRLMWQIPRWVETIRPRWVACEQVTPALPWYQTFALRFEELGYKTWVGIINAANHGVAQTRRRAFLLASTDIQPVSPPRTHTENPDSVDALFGDRLLPWVTMADVLDWGMEDRPYFTLAPGTNSGGADHAMLGGSWHRKELYAARATGRWRLGGSMRKDDRGHPDETGYRARDWRSDDRPSATLTAKARSWVRKPLTVVETDVAGAPDPNRQIKLTLTEALILQSFPANYRLAGSMTSGFRQVGNAVAPLVARAVLEQFMSTNVQVEVMPAGLAA